MDNDDVVIVTPEEKEQLKLETALQLLAVFVRRFGGDVVISRREFDMVEGLPLLGGQLTPEHLRLRIPEMEWYGEPEGVMSEDLPDDF